MSEEVSNPPVQTSLGPQVVPDKPIRVLLLDDREENLVLRSAILRQKGYSVVTSSSIEEAESKIQAIDIAVLDYHLGSGKFGTDVAETLRRKRPQVPIIILSATLERKFGGIADMHLLKGYSSVDDLVNALRSFEAKKRGRPVVVDARDFYYSRISMAMGDDIVLEILDRDGNWQFVNDYFASMNGHKRAWFAGKNLFRAIPSARRRVARDPAHGRGYARNVHRSPWLSRRIAPAPGKPLLVLERADLPHQTTRRPRRRRTDRETD